MPHPAEHFSATAAVYAATMAPSLRPIAAEVVRRAELGPGERVIDIGTGTGTGAALARGDGREVVGVDAASGMLAIARRDVAGATFHEMDFGALAFDDGTFDAALAVHALLFADDRSAVLAEWRRVVRPGGRLSLSVPGPAERTPSALYAEIYERYGIDTAGRYPAAADLADLVATSRWAEVRVATDPTTAIVLPDEAAFRAWRGIGSRGAATAEWTPDQHRVLTDEMLAVTPRTPDGAYRIPFGTVYLSARRN